jgi:bifunctional UDP-N-acetylglucosamine pyrophosphorylase/glucosamine-1-phosphate N-acetyltransferase
LTIWHIGESAKIGSFVEVKKSTVGKDSKISHLSYVGDTVMGAGLLALSPVA